VYNQHVCTDVQIMRFMLPLERVLMIDYLNERCQASIEMMRRDDSDRRTMERVTYYDEMFENSILHIVSHLQCSCLSTRHPKQLAISTYAQPQSAESEHPLIIPRFKMDDDSCYAGREEYDAFLETQAPQRRCMEGRSRAPKYETVRVGELSTSRNAEEIHENWLQSKRLYTLRTDGRWRNKANEMETLLRVYKHAQDMGATGVDFRDAIVDAVAEVLDDWGLIYYFPCELLHTVSAGIKDCPLRQLVAFYYALTKYPPRALPSNGRPAYDNDVFEQCWRDEYAKLQGQNNGTNRKIWEDFLVCGRCVFHEHANSRCWRAKPASAVRNPETTTGTEVHKSTDTPAATSQREAKL
jgi:hypothetical protein